MQSKLANISEDHSVTQATGQIVAAFLTRNNLAAEELPELIRKVHSTLAETSGQQAGPTRLPPKDVANSITPDYLVCLEDGKHFRSLKRHLRQRFGLTPDQYRAKWGLGEDYPMVAPNYSARRSELARNAKLGHR